MESKPGDLEGVARTSEKVLGKEAEPTVNIPQDPAPNEVFKASEPTEDVPDPDEDDLDDLDGKPPI